MNDKETKTLRKLLSGATRGENAHLEFDAAVRDFPEGGRGKKPAGAPHSAWELVEHLRLAQHDILEFSRNPNHVSPEWPRGYWPEAESPPSESAWEKSIAGFRRDAKEFEKLIGDLKNDLLKPFSHGEGQTLLREALLIANHNSYHLGQLEFLKKMLINDR